MDQVFAIFLVKLIDPFSFFPALACSYLVRRWWQIFIVGIGIAITLEAFLTASQVAHQFGEWLVIGAAASTIHAAIGYLATRRLRANAASRRDESIGFDTPSERLTANMKLAGEKIVETKSAVGVNVAKLMDKARRGTKADETTSTAKPAVSAEEKLQELKKLFEQNLITAEEYNLAKKRVLEIF